MTTVNLSEDLESFIRDAVSSGRYASADSVISEALDKLRNTMGPIATSSAPGEESSGSGKQLTKQEFQRHLVNIGLLDQPDQADNAADDPDRVLIDNEGEVLSEMVIRERLIEWLASFL